MALDPRYICSSDLESIFLDKLDGFPLAAGTVEFYVDGTNVPKQVYTTTGSPPTGFIPIGSVVTLNSIGGYEYLNNSIALFYFPYDLDDPTKLQLYKVVVKNSGGQLQFTREAWPPIANTIDNVITQNEGIKNYIPNGQFITHNDAPLSDTTSEAGLTILPIAQGGWSFKKTTAGTSVYNITFNSEIGGIAGLRDFPYYSVNIECTSFNIDTTVRDLVIQWPNVNTFQSLDAAGVQINAFNFLVAGKVTSGTQNFVVSILSNYGNGGSPDVEVTIGTITLTTSYAYTNLTIEASDMPSNAGKTIGAGNFFAIRIRCPENSFNARFTDFALTLGTKTLTAFPVSTPAEMLSNSVAGWIPTPNPDGSDLYLPPILTDKGMIFDDSLIGTLVAKFSSTAVNNELPMDGSSYGTAGYSSLGIPYARLQAKLLAISPGISLGIPVFGTGTNFVNAYVYAGATNIIRLVNNSSGAGSAVTLGNTGWTAGLTTTAVVGRTSINYTAYNNIADSIIAICNTLNVNAALSDGPGAQATGLTLGLISSNTLLTGYTSEFRYSFAVTSTLGGGGLSRAGNPAKYFLFSDATTDYYMWFFYTNETDPAVAGRTGIKVIIPSNTITNQEIVNVIREAFNSFNTTSVTVTSVPTVGKYFTFTTNPSSSRSFYVYYTVDGNKSDPNPGGNGIEVKILSADTINQVASKTMLAINNQQFGLQNMQGMFIRGNDPNGIWDTDSYVRLSNIAVTASASLGSLEYQNFLSHQHAKEAKESVDAGATVITLNGNAAPITLYTQKTGGDETRPVNMSINWFIKY